MTISVTQLNNYIRGLFDVDGVLNNVAVCGEVTNLKRSGNGWYFSLKDDGGAINCFSYFNNAEPVAGSMVMCEGQVNYFAKTGSISLFVRRLSVTGNLGAAYARFVELKEKLQKEGLFDESRKRTVPRSCSKIGVVTSETGAVIHDIKNVVLRRQPFSQIILYPVKVQGEGADTEIAQGVAYFENSDVDVVIVGRGGGSNEDLSAFNAECVVRAVAQCSKPIVSAVGHGVDFTLCDFAADKRAVTPTEAAEFVTLDCNLLKKRIADLLRVNSARLEEKFLSITSRVKTNSKLASSFILRRIEKTEADVKSYLNRATSAVQSFYNAAGLQLKNITDRMNSANPVNILKRGYSFVSNEQGAVTSISQIQIGQQVDVVIYDGKFNAVVTQKETK